MKVNPQGTKLSTACKVNCTKPELFRLTFAERLAKTLSPNQKRHFTFWIKFGLSLKFGLSERLIQKVKSPILVVQFSSECSQLAACGVLCLGIYSERIVSASYVVTQRLYMHRALKKLAVVEVDVERADVSEPIEFLVELNRWVASYDLTFVTEDSGKEEVRFVVEFLSAS